MMKKITIKSLAKTKARIKVEKDRLRQKKKINIIIHMGTCGIASGAQKIMNVILKKIEQLNLLHEIGLYKSGCIGLCGKEPLVTIEICGEEPIIYQEMNQEKILEVLDKHILSGKPIAKFALARGRQDQVKERINSKGIFPNEKVLDDSIPGIEEIPFFRNQHLRILRNRGLIDPEKITDYIARDGYMTLNKVLTVMSAEDIIQEVTDSGLKGRGGAGFPTGLKWQFAARENNSVKYIIGNADEGDPGAYMDRSILESDPHAVIEGMIIAAKAIGANQGYVYCRAEYPLAIKILSHAIKQAEAYGFLGSNILGTDFSFQLKIYCGAGAFVCGEETALMRSIEGKRGMPVPRPPFPAHSGLWGKPTILNNVETLANIPLIIRNGSQWFASIGTKESKGTKVFALTGDVKNVGLIEVPIGIALSAIIFDIGGGIPNGKRLKAAQIGGPSGGCIPASHLNVPVDYQTIKDLGAIMGSGGLIVLNEDKCAVDIARYFMDFCQEESCGKCVPCREGTKRVLEILSRICKGNGTTGDIELLEKMSEIIKNTSLCGLGQTAPNPVLTTLRYFREEYDAHIRDQYCPAGACRELARYHIDPDKCIGCGLCKKACPVNAISGDKKQVHQIDAKVCIKCGQCYGVCQFDAVIKR